MANGSRSKIVYILLVTVTVLLLFNQYMLFSFTSKAGLFSMFSSSSSGSTPTSTSSSIVGANGIIPTGIPAIYGNELGIRYDDVSASNPSLADSTIKKLSVFDTSITLTSEKLQRYINIGMQISCEYCCGAKAIIFNDGKAACGCAHSQAMRGLAKYLLDKHSGEFTDNQILEELGKWKALFFPNNAIQKAAVLKQKGIEFNYINLESNKYRGIEQGTTSGSGSQMVGGC